MAVADVDAVGARTPCLAMPARRCALRTDTPMAIGSVGKALTGLLLADLDAAGAVSADLSAVEALAVDDAGLAQVTLEDLATHQSGLPRLPLSRLLGGLAASVAGANPYAGWDGDRVRKAAAGRALDCPSEFSCSNLGAASPSCCWRSPAGVLGVARGGNASRPLDREDVIAAAPSTALTLFLLRQLGSWHSMPPAVWWFTVAVVGTRPAVGVLQLKHLPTASGKHARWRWIRGGVSASVSLGLLTALLVA